MSQMSVAKGRCSSATGMTLTCVGASQRGNRGGTPLDTSTAIFSRIAQSVLSMLPKPEVADAPAAVDLVVPFVKFSHQFAHDVVVSSDDDGIFHLSV